MDAAAPADPAPAPTEDAFRFGRPLSGEVSPREVSPREVSSAGASSGPSGAELPEERAGAAPQPVRDRATSASSPPAPAPVRAVQRPAYVHRECKLVSTPSGGWGLVGANVLLGVAETPETLGALVERWTRDELVL